MRIFGEFSGTRARLAFIVTGLLLIGYISLLVGMNYVSRTRLEESALEQFRQDMEKRATAIGYFFSERKNDLKELAASRAVSAFFENKALGMSMEYGLRASLLGITKNFDRHLADRKLDEDRIFDRIILVDSYGKLLVDSRQQGEKKEPEKGWKEFLTPGNRNATMIVLQDRQPLRLMVSAPCFFKKRYAAQIMAWISPSSVCRLLEAEGESPRRSVFIVSGKALFPLRAGLSYEAALTDLPNLDTLEIGKTYRFDAVNKDESKMDIIAARVPIEDTPFFLVSLVPAAEVHGSMASWHLPVAMGILAIIILCGIAFAFRINTQKLILHARLEEASKREQEIQVKNRQLKLEITSRERAEEALRKAQEELEIKIRERTKELAESNTLLKREIMQRKQAEETIRESEAKYRSIFEATGTATLIVEEDTTISMANTEFEKLSGYSKEELEGRMSWTGFVVREDLERMKEYHAGRREENGSAAPEEYEIRFVDKHGDVKHILNKVAMIPGTGKSIASLLDITPRKLGEEALEKEKEKFRLLVERSPLGISIVQEDGHYKYINPKFIEIFGYTLEDIPTGRDWFRRAFPDKQERKQAISTWITDLKRSRLNEIRTQIFTVTCKDGSQKVIHFRAVATETGNHIVIYEDITEKRRLEAQLNQAQKMEAIGVLAGGVAHDFNNLLTSIIGNAELSLMDLGENSTLYKEMTEILKAGHRAASLTRQLLAFSRKELIRPEVLDLNSVTMNFEKMLRRLIGEDIDLVAAYAPDPWHVEADPGQMEQVIMNLSVNARDAMPKGGKLTIETENVELDEVYFREHGAENETGPYVMLAVTDNGTGMDKETQARIFEPFFTTKERGRGTGLGLSTVFGIVKQNKGHIWAYSEEGKGTTFKVYLPKAEADRGAVEEEQSPEHLLRGSETILLAEDDEMLRKMAERILGGYGYKVLAAGDGREAIKISESHDGPIHLLLTDVVMPSMSGQDLAVQLQVKIPAIKVLYMSGYTDDAIAHHGVLEKEVEFIQKPFSREGLASKVREVLDKKQD